MKEFRINSKNGPHAGAELSDADIQFLCGVVLWELALRTDPEEFADFLRQTIERRGCSEGALETTRHERDMMRFAAEVMLDIQQLPATTEEKNERGTGLYL